MTCASLCTLQGMFVSWTMGHLAVLIILGPAFTLGESVKTSKACYGAPGLPCTKHTLDCSSGMIAIQDAYYTNSTACPDVGLSTCANINVSSIPDTGRYRDFSDTQLNNLYKNCSSQQRCTFNSGGKSASVFSVVKFICRNVITSKACYGTQNPLFPCTKHTLECSSGMIAIQDAYYTNSTACPVVGLSSCNIDVSSIPDTGRYQNFSETQLNNLYGNCSNQQSCTFNVVRRSVITFSIVKYICTNGATTTDYISTVKFTTVTETGDSFVSGQPAPPESVSYEFPGGIYVAGIFTGVGVLLLSGSLIYFLFIRRRFDVTKKQEAVPALVTHPTYAGLSGPQETNNYDVINRESNAETLHPSLYENVAKSP